MRLIKWSLLSLLIALVGYALASLILVWVLTKPSRRPVGDIPAELPAATQSVTFPARDGLRLSGWFVPCDNTDKAVVLLHGNGSTRRQMLARARLFHDTGYAVLLYDARGHGLSEGTKVSAGWFETSDLLGAFDFLRAKNYREFGCLGASQGAATILLSAERLPAELRWVIIESTYPTLRDALDRRFRKHALLPGWFAGALFAPLAEWHIGMDIDQLSPLTHIQNLPCPVLILGGAEDRLTLPASTQALFDAAKQPKELWLVPHAAHVDLYGAAQQEYAHRILAFVHSVRP